MKDYQKSLDSFTSFADKGKIEEYLIKYWLDKKELDDVWLEIKNTVFNPGFKELPDPVFNEYFDNIIRKSGLVLDEVEFELLQSCMKTTGDKHFVILEEHNPYTSEPPYRLKYPINITWEEITSGGDPYTVSYDVFFRPIRNFFVFGDSGKWGKYAGNDYEWPLDITGFDKKYSDLFLSKFKIPKEDVKDLKEWTAFYGMKLPGID